MIDRIEDLRRYAQAHPGEHYDDYQAIADDVGITREQVESVVLAVAAARVMPPHVVITVCDGAIDVQINGKPAATLEYQADTLDVAAAISRVSKGLGGAAVIDDGTEP